MNDTWTPGTIATVTVSAVLFCIALIAAITYDCFRIYLDIRAYLIQRQLARQ